MANHKLNFIQRIMLQHANPLKFATDSVGVLISAYFFWQRNIILALVVLFGFSFLGTLLVWGRHEEKLRRSSLGKWMIGQAHPMNLLVRGTGAVVIAYGLWVHSIALIFVGILLLIVARQWVLKIRD